jgi:homoserine dehydrogenase
MDIDGFDTACKLVIMANWIMDRKVTLKDVAIQGIRNVNIENLEAAAKNSNAVKLVGSINNGLNVKPTEIAKNDPLCVSGVTNAVTFVSMSAGEETIIGRGAGGMETASAILRDVLHIKKALMNRRLS